MTNRKLQIALFALLVGTGCSDDPDPTVDDVGQDVAELADIGLNDADATEERPEFINCYDLKPDECRLHRNEPGVEDPFKCRIMGLAPFDHEAQCFDGSKTEAYCVFHDDIGDNSEGMLLSPEGDCYWISSQPSGHPPGWQIADIAEEGEVPEDCLENEGKFCTR